MKNVGSRITRELPSGSFRQILAPCKGYFSIIMPEQSTNLILNPSFEGGDTTGYVTHQGLSIAATFDWQAYGACGLQVFTNTLSQHSGVKYGTVALTADTTYTLSATIQGIPGQRYSAWFGTNLNVLIGSRRSFVATGRKQRIHVTYTETASLNRLLFFTMDSPGGVVQSFYVDGVQLEAKPYPTTFIDGEQRYFSKYPGYFWNGTPRASTSYRTAQNRAGGREVSFDELGILVSAVMGLGMNPTVDQSLPIPGFGEFFQGYGSRAREFTLLGSVFSDSPYSPRRLQEIRSGIIQTVRPDIVIPNQQITLKYQATDDDGEPASEETRIICSYLSGLDGNWDNHGRENIALTFKMHDPFLQNYYTNGAELGFQTTVEDFTNIGYRDTDGTWHPMAVGIASAQIEVIRPAPDGSIYVGGNFANASGVANTADLAKFNMSAWSSVVAGISTGPVYAIQFDANGVAYIGGTFLNAGGVAAADGLFKWDGNTVTAVSTGTVGTVHAILIAKNGLVYIAGNFASYGGVGGTANLAVWDGTTITPMGTGTNGPVYALAEGLDGTIYIGGAFNTADGVSAYNAAKWDGTDFTPLVEATLTADAGFDSSVYTIAVGFDGLIYFGGAFLMAGDVPASHLAIYNGVSFAPMGLGAGDDVQVLTVEPSTGNVYIGGDFTTLNEWFFPDRMGVWNGSTFLPVDINVQDTIATVTAIAFDRHGRLFIGGTWTGTEALSATSAVQNLGSKAHPRITFKGPGGIWQVKNYTTGKTIAFQGITLLVGEEAVLDLDPTNITFISSFRGNIMKHVLPASDLTMELIPGTNNLSTFMWGGTTGASRMWISWQGIYSSIDEVAV